MLIINLMNKKFLKSHKLNYFIHAAFIAVDSDKKGFIDKK